MSGNSVINAEPVMAVPVDITGMKASHSHNHNQSGNQWGGMHGGGVDWSGHGGQGGMNVHMEQNVYEMGGDVNGKDGHGNWTDDTIERSGNLFGQLDSMIAAVQNESSALDSMREKLRELDGMRVQLSSLTKRLLEADQANLTLKSNLVKIQEAYADVRRQKQEMESAMVPLRQELNRTKDMYSKERMARLSAQQETSMLKDQLLRLEKINEDLERDVKSIPALAESNELLKTDLTRIRNRYKEEKNSLTNSNNSLLEQNRDLEASKAEIRGLAVRLLDLASQSSQGAAKRGGASAVAAAAAGSAAGGASSGTAAGGQDKRTPAHQQALQWEQQQQQFQQFQMMQMQQQQMQQQMQQQQQQQMLTSQSMQHLQQGYGQYQPVYRGGGGDGGADSNRGSPSSVNDGRGLADQDQPFLSHTLEEHMLGTAHHNIASPAPQGYYGGVGVGAGDDDLSVGSHHSKLSQVSQISQQLLSGIENRSPAPGNVHVQQSPAGGHNPQSLRKR